MTEFHQKVLTEFKIMETKRCVLRKVTLDDIEDMYEYCSNKSVATYTKFSPHKTLEDTKFAIQNIFIPQELTKWGIIYKKTGKLIGTIDFMTLTDDYATLGYALSESFWGQGIIPEVATELLRLAFDELNLKVVYATHHKDNLKSGRVMQKIGMTKWGKDYYFNFKGQPLVETVKYGITMDEYNLTRMSVNDEV